VARIAGLLHFAKYGKESLAHKVDVNVISASCVFGVFFMEHAAAIFGAAGEDKRVKVAKQILDSITRNKMREFTGRDVLRTTNIPSMEEALPGLKILSERGFIRELTRVAGHSQGYEVNPKINF